MHGLTRQLIAVYSEADFVDPNITKGPIVLNFENNLRFEQTTYITLEVYRAPVALLKPFRNGQSGQQILRLTGEALTALGTALREVKQTPGVHWTWDIEVDIQKNVALMSQREKQREKAKSKSRRTARAYKNFNSLTDAPLLSRATTTLPATTEATKTTRMSLPWRMKVTLDSISLPCPGLSLTIC